VANGLIVYSKGMDYRVGLDSPSGDTGNNGVQGVPTSIPNAGGMIVGYGLTAVSSDEDLQTAVGVSAAASGGVGLFSASAAFPVLPVPTGASAEGDISVRLVRPGAGRLALLLVAVLAAGLAVAVTVSSGSRDHVTRSAASARLPVAIWGPVSRALGADDPAYRAAPAGAGLALRNPRQKLAARFSTAGVSIRSGALTVGLQLRGYGYGERVRALAAVAPTADENRVLYRHGSVSEWYANGPLGLEQGFSLTARPAGRGAGPLTLALVLSGNARGVLARGRGGVTFSRDGSSLSYRGLVVTDASGRTLPAWPTLRGRELLLRVNDARARYPLRVDPFIQ
jgi:hypothetical protein